MNKVLIVLPHYLPGYKSGGPQQTVKNICDVFRKYSNIFLVTQNQDFGENVPYELETNRWLRLYGIQIMYVSPKEYNCKLLWELYNQFDTILACGLFCSSTIQLMEIHRILNKSRLYIAPMGVFSKNALAIRSSKKKIFLRVFSFIGAFKKIIWSFTSKEEQSEAIEAIGRKNINSYIIAEDLPRSLNFDAIRLACGCVPLISNTTPWKDLTKMGCGSVRRVL